jgi:hypothetical protein
MTDSNDESPAPDKVSAAPDCDDCGHDQAGCMATLMLVAVGAAPISFITGVAGCIVARDVSDGKGGWDFVPAVLIVACWLFGAIGIVFAMMNSAIRERWLTKYLPLVLCIAAPAIPTVWFYCTARPLP